ncbi:MAG: putative amidohydrolase [Candidatus Azotimanducaceae bacterium]|jgi:predicted amidohydrolase
MPSVAVIQMTSSASVDKSLKRAESLILEAAKSVPDAIFLPENFPALGSTNPYAIGYAERGGKGPIFQFLTEMAFRTRSWIFAGTMPIASLADGSATESNRVRAASLVINSSGERVARYDKIHMFDAEVADGHRNYRESSTFEPGTAVVAVDSPVGRVGLSVCYDLRFPELYRQLFLEKCDLIAVPSAFTRVTGAAHFEVLLRARAIENTSYIVAACQVGTHDSGRETYGHSMVISPWGERLGCLERDEGVLHVPVDLGKVKEIRADMPFLSQAKLLTQ